MAQYDFNEHIAQKPEYSKWLNKDEFEVKVGGKRHFMNCPLSNAGFMLLQYAVFHLNRTDKTIKVVSYRKDKPEYMPDDHLIMVSIISHQAAEFYQNYEFSPKGFNSFIKWLMRPIAKSCCPENRRQRERKFKSITYNNSIAI